MERKAVLLLHRHHHHLLLLFFFVACDGGFYPATRRVDRSRNQRFDRRRLAAEATPRSHWSGLAERKMDARLSFCRSCQGYAGCFSGGGGGVVPDFLATHQNLIRGQLHRLRRVVSLLSGRVLLP